MVNMETIRSALASFISVRVRSDVLVTRPRVLCFLDLVAAAITILKDLFLLLDQSFGHFVHVVRVDFGEMSRCAVLKGIYRGGVQAIFQIAEGSGSRLGNCTPQSGSPREWCRYRQFP